MNKFKKEKTEKIPVVSTASLPDIVFMLLFFFMVSTVMREADLKIKLTPPSATEIKKLENKSLVSYVYIGEPVDIERNGDAPRIQLNDAFADISEIGRFVVAAREPVDERLRPKLTTSLKVDRDTEMGIVTEVKQELRKVSALKINYSTTEKVVKKK